MFVSRVLYEVVLLLSCLWRADGTVTVTPSNTAVVAGSWMSMECRTTNGSTVYRWTLTRPTSSTKEYLFMNYSGERTKVGLTYPYGVDVDEQGSGLLYLNATRLDDAGLYTCYSFVGDKRQQQQQSAQLIVFEREPFCETNYTAEKNATLKEGETIWMQCRVNFRGMWAPAFEWKQHTEDDKPGEDNNQETVLRGVSTAILPNSSITTTLIFVANFNKTVYFSCKMFFQWHNGSVKMTAENLPNYTYTWISPRLVPEPKITEEAYVMPSPVEVRPLDTTTPKPSVNNDWYIISLILLFAVVIFVSLLIGLGIRRHVRRRRQRDLNMIYNASTSSTVPFRRQERPPPIDYDIVPNAMPNIYERIDGADGDDDAADHTSPNCHPPLTECYSGLMGAVGNDACQYDTLDLYAKMDMVKQESAQSARGSPAYPGQENGEERYTTPVPRRGMAKPDLPSGSSDYLEVVGDTSESTRGVKPLYVDVPDDSDEDSYMHPDCKQQMFNKGSDDYLQPGPTALDNCPNAYLKTA